MSSIKKILEGVSVEWKTLKEIALISAAGVDKKIIKTENSVTLLNYMDVYRNPYINAKTPTMQVTANDAKLEQCNVLKGDIFITPSSEVKNEIGFSAMAVEDMPDVVYSYHIMRIRLYEYNLTQSMFINYLFRSNSLQSQINKQAKGLTRFGLTKTQWEDLLIPIPCPENPTKSLEIQKEIVRILDTFTERTETLIYELTTELEARKKQYNYYREMLFGFDDKLVKHLPLGHDSIGKFIRGGGLQKKDFTESGIGCIHYGQIYTYYGTYTNRTKTFISEEFAKKARMAKHGDLVIATTSENDEDVCKAVVWLGSEEIAVSSDACFYTHSLNPKYVAYFFQTEQFQKQKRPFITGTKVRRVNADDLAKIKIPVPSPEEQERIVVILDKLENLSASISEDLPKEKALRKKQYEYYRDLLLTFPNDNLKA
jgi:type I restriction enzyme, S subunit